MPHLPCRPHPVALAALLVIITLVTACTLLWAETPVRPSPQVKGTVIVLHGLARTSRSMIYIANGLRKNGYRVENIDYPSTRLPLPDLIEHYLAPAVRRAAANGEEVHIVSHSMGGILARYYLAHHPDLRIGRVVMLAPPNSGSELIDLVAASSLFPKTLGPAAGQLTTFSPLLADTLPPPAVDIGIIAGTRSLNPLFSFIVPGEDDGKVSVASTRLATMRDHLVLRIDHTLILWNREVLDQTLYFLEHGAFNHASGVQ